MPSRNWLLGSESSPSSFRSSGRRYSPPSPVIVSSPWSNQRKTEEGLFVECHVNYKIGQRLWGKMSEKHLHHQNTTHPIKNTCNHEVLKFKETIFGPFFYCLSRKKEMTWIVILLISVSFLYSFLCCHSWFIAVLFNLFYYVDYWTSRHSSNNFIPNVRH